MIVAPGANAASVPGMVGRIVKEVIDSQAPGPMPNSPCRPKPVQDCPAEEVRIGKFLEGDDVAEAGKHADEVGEVTGIVDRAGKDARRKENLKGRPKVPGKDLDEYPPAVIKPDDPSVVSVKPIDSSHNRRSGGRLRHELPPDGTRVRITPPGKSEKK